MTPTPTQTPAAATAPPPAATQTPGAAPAPTPPATAWTAWHLHLGTTARSAHDRVVTDVIGPTIRELAPGTPWFFIRYWQSGPHLRLRVGDLDAAARPRVAAALTERLAVAGAPAPGEEPLDPAAYRSGAERLAAAGETGENTSVKALLPPGVHPAVYEPEFDRYGGRALMPAAESLFTLSSTLVLAALPKVRDERQRALLALRGTVAVAAALGDPAERAYYYAHGLGAWRAWAAEAGHPAELLDTITRVEGTAALDPDAHGPFAGWHARIAAHADEIRAQSPTHPGMVLFSHAHMLHNRLGLSLLEELRTYAVLAHAFPLPTGALQGGAPVPRTG
ncbi:thiopeptide-type bacteriocin biosynthesis protein [Streptomyces sp. NPDC127584]|uniref:thiopeptide-type bacteriocin biosynthesis protein n=1 Tax=Streptomyces sp. NPDC127584 TaxID=3345403 RepID=UPI00362CB02A